MIPNETIKRLAIQCEFEGFAGTCMCSFDQLQAFANAIEAMTIDRCLAMSRDKADIVEAIRALKDD